MLCSRIDLYFCAVRVFDFTSSNSFCFLYNSLAWYGLLSSFMSRRLSIALKLTKDSVFVLSALLKVVAAVVSGAFLLILI